MYFVGLISGLEILAFPCNQFLKQEPGSSQEAEEFACTRYKAEYPIFGKVWCLVVCVGNLDSLLIFFSVGLLFLRYFLTYE